MGVSSGVDRYSDITRRASRASKMPGNQRHVQFRYHKLLSPNDKIDLKSPADTGEVHVRGPPTTEETYGKPAHAVLVDLSSRTPRSVRVTLPRRAPAKAALGGGVDASVGRHRPLSDRLTRPRSPELKFAFPDAARGAVDQSFRLIVRAGHLGQAGAHPSIQRVRHAAPVTFDGAYIAIADQRQRGAEPAAASCDYLRRQASVTVAPGKDVVSDAVSLPFCEERLPTRC